MNNYILSDNADWFSHAQPLFTQYLQSYIDQPVHFLEIGSFEGRSAIWMLENILTHSNASLTCIDPWQFNDTQLQSVFKNFQHNVSVFDDKVTYHQGRLIDRVSYLPSHYYDFIYIDGNHYGKDILLDAVLSFDLLKPNSIMAFDDYKFTMEEHVDQCLPQKAIDAFLSVYNEYITIIYKQYQVWIKKNTKNT